MADQFEASREEQLSEKRLKWGYWWVTHRLRAKTAFTVALAVVAFGFFGYATYGFADWFFGSGVGERANLAELTRTTIDYGAFHEADAPQPLAVGVTQMFVGSSGSYDFVVDAVNPNAAWVARFDYHFEFAGGRTAARRSFVLPGDRAWLDALGTRTEGSPSGATLRIENLTWQRVDTHDTRPDYAIWSASRLGIGAVDAKFLHPTPDDPLSTSRAAFTLVNDTAFSYRRVSLVVTLWSGSAMLGVSRVTVSDLRAGGRRGVEAVWLGDVPGVTRIEVKPDLDVFDPGIYLPTGR
jgi:hypothetical protein